MKRKSIAAIATGVLCLSATVVLYGGRSRNADPSFNNANGNDGHRTLAESTSNKSRSRTSPGASHIVGIRETGSASPAEIKESFRSVRESRKNKFESGRQAIKQAKESGVVFKQGTVKHRFLSNIVGVSGSDASLGAPLWSENGISYFKSGEAQSDAKPAVIDEKSGKLGIFNGRIIVKFASPASLSSLKLNLSLAPTDVFSHLGTAFFDVSNIEIEKLPTIMGHARSTNGISDVRLDLTYERQEPL